MSGVLYYSNETNKAMRQRTLERDAADDASLKYLGGSIRNYADLEKDETIRARQEARQEEYTTPRRKELEAFFDDLGLEPLPPPLPKAAKSSSRPPYLRSYNSDQELEPFTTACREGVLDTVKYWAGEKRDMLRQGGLQLGLAFACLGNQIDTVHYLLGEGGAFLDGAVIELAWTNLSLPMFELAVEHSYHPNQQIPSIRGSMSTAINHCLASFEVTQFLLANGADPDIGPWQDTRCQGWGDRATPPMDRQSGVALDRAVKQGYLAVAELLLRSGAHVEYCRPIHVLINRKAQDWRPFMDLLSRYEVDVNASKASRGSHAPFRPLHYAVHREMWDLVEYLLEHGADPYKKCRPDGIDAFKIAARDADKRRESSSSNAPVDEPNPLLEIFERVERKKGDVQGQKTTTTEV